MHRFGRQTAGQVRAGAPSMVVSIDVAAGDHVAAGQTLGLLEAMKMEIGFAAPVAGVVTEVRVRARPAGRGRRRAARDRGPSRRRRRTPCSGCALPEEGDPFTPFFTTAEDGWLGTPDLPRPKR